MAQSGTKAGWTLALFFARTFANRTTVRFVNAMPDRASATQRVRN